MDAKKVQSAITIINDCKSKIEKALTGEAMLSIKIDRVLTELVAGMERSINVLGNNKTTNLKPLNRILDFDISEDTEEVHNNNNNNNKRVLKTEKIEFERKVDELYRRFNDLKLDEIVRSPNKLLILGVAKKAGVPFTDHEDITEEFIVNIRKAILENNASQIVREKRKAYDNL